MNEDLVGFLSQTAGDTQFQYTEEAKRPISLSLPLREEKYSQKHCFHFFEGLLPESDGARKAIGRKFGANPNNPFSILKAIGQDCAGAISFFEPGTREDIESKSSLKILNKKKLAKQIDDLESNPLFLGVKGVRISLAGFQEKAAVVLTESSEIALPIARPSTHILKPAIKGYADSAMNEYLTMELAKSLDLDVPEVQLGEADGRTYLLVERYDRSVRKGIATRLHQEDFCQALSFAPSRKYQEDNGPTFRDCVNLIGETAIPALDLFKLIDYIIFNYLVGNTDAHGKNFSLLYRENKPVLAPLYDCICLTIDEQFRQEMAMKIGNRSDINKVTKKDWQAFCETIDFKYGALEERLKHFTYSIVEEVSKQRERTPDNDFKLAWIEEIENRSKQCIKRLKL